MREIIPEEDCYTKWRPSTVIEAQLWCYADEEFGNGSFFPVEMWPDGIVEIFLKRHKKHNQRFQLAKFFAGNGLETTRIKSAIFAIFASEYDKQAKDDIDWLVRKFDSNEVTCTYYDILLQQNKSLIHMLRGDTLN